MAGSDENYGNVMGHRKFQGDMQGGTRKVMAPIGHNRRALKEINRNIIEVPPLYPCAVSKRVCFEKNAMPQKDPPIPVNRRITRRFAAQMASMQQSTTEETNKSKQSVSSAREPRERAVSDAEDYKETSDMSVPMFVQHTEAMLDEIDQMDKEIEMEELYEELELDIDSCDTKDPLAVVEYVDDIYGYYTKMESESRVPSHYMDRQSDINERMRGILMDWLIEVHYKFELMDETLYLTVSLIDRFLAVQPVVRKKLQLVGITAMLVACKYEEVSVPVVEDFIVITDRAYSRQDVIQMERLMINTLNFNLSLPTPYVFMRRFLKAAGSDKKLELVSFFMIELCLVEYDMLKFPPSLLAAAAIFTAQCTLSRFMEWSKTCEWHTNYAIEHLLECSKRMVTFHKKAATGNLTGVHKKYSTSKFGYAARSEPALFLLESRF